MTNSKLDPISNKKIEKIKSDLAPLKLWSYSFFGHDEFIYYLHGEIF
jgi:hypothetical protein